MREIKFRAWNPETKTMVYELEEINLLGTNIVAGISSGLIKASYMNGRGLWIEAELMQYTGLKDRNGRDIYEGDINGSDEPMYVAYQDGCFGLKFKNNPSYFDSCINWDQLEIIGNIYQNPELLEEQHG